MNRTPRPHCQRGRFFFERAPGFSCVSCGTASNKLSRQNPNTMPGNESEGQLFKRLLVLSVTMRSRIDIVSSIRPRIPLTIACSACSVIVGSTAVGTIGRQGVVTSSNLNFGGTSSNPHGTTPSTPLLTRSGIKRGVTNRAAFPEPHPPARQERPPRNILSRIFEPPANGAPLPSPHPHPDPTNAKLCSPLFGNQFLGYLRLRQPLSIPLLQQPRSLRGLLSLLEDYIDLRGSQTPTLQSPRTTAWTMFRAGANLASGHVHPERRPPSHRVDSPRCINVRVTTYVVIVYSD